MLLIKKHHIVSPRIQSRFKAKFLKSWFLCLLCNEKFKILKDWNKFQEHHSKLLPSKAPSIQESVHRTLGFQQWQLPGLNNLYSKIWPPLCDSLFPGKKVSTFSYNTPIICIICLFRARKFEILAVQFCHFYVFPKHCNIAFWCDHLCMCLPVFLDDSTAKIRKFEKQNFENLIRGRSQI